MADPPKAEDFMLAPKDEKDGAKFLPPSRKDNKIEPLIDGEAAFVAFEEAIADAKESVYCAFWSMYPDTPLLSTKVKNAMKVKTWQELFIKINKVNKVKVRVLISDFDPILDNNHHQRAWKGYHKFVKLAVKEGVNKDQFQVFCSLHPAVIPGSGAFLDPVDFLSKQSLKALIASFNKAKLAGVENSPGVWGYLKLSAKKLKMADKPKFQIFPASYHQKTLVVDNKIGFLGGINISTHYHDTPKHLKSRVHDIFCRIEGPAVTDLERNFVGRWNSEYPAYNTFVTNANGKKLGSFKINDKFAISTLTLSKTVHSAAGSATAQVHRTLSSAISGSFPNLTVTVERNDISQTYEKAILLANEYIYIENQYVRVVGLADWIIKRFKANKKLQVIIVVPILPEEVEQGNADPLTLHGIYLQHETLTKLKTGLGKNLGLYSLVQNKKTPASASTNLSSFDSLRIYPHSKVLIVDDLFASIGSANINPRGFELDSEIDVGWYEAASVKAFREELWKEHLGSPTGSLFATWKASEYVKEWDAIASKNSTAKPGLRQGFVVPHDLDLAKGAKQVFPDFLAELGNKGREDQKTTIG